MNNRTAKKIRSIIKPDDSTTRRVYRRAKRQYTKTPNNLKKDFIASLRILMSGD